MGFLRPSSCFLIRVNLVFPATPSLATRVRLKIPSVQSSDSKGSRHSAIIDPSPLDFSIPPTMSALSFGLLTGIAGYAVLHNFRVRGDVILFFELSLFATLSFIGKGSDELIRDGLLFAFRTICIHSAVMLACTAVYRLSPWHPVAHVPGPIYYKLGDICYTFVVASGWRHEVVRGLHKRYGDFVRIGPNTVSINNRAAIGPIYGSTQCMDRSAAYNLASFPGDGLFFMLSRDRHNTRRNRWAPAFTSMNLQCFHEVLNRRTRELAQCLIARRDPAGIVDLSTAIEHWSYDFMGDFAFGHSTQLELMRNGDPDRLVEAGKQSTALFDILGTLPWLYEILSRFGTPSSLLRLYKAASHMLDLRQLRGSELQDDITDVSSCLLKFDIKDGGNLSRDEQLLDAIFAIQAGSDTSANVLQYTFFFIAAHQQCLKKLQAELDDTFPNKDDILDLDRLASLPYLNAVINECLRLGTPLSGLPRVTPASGITVNNIHIPAGTVVSVPNYTQQLDPRSFAPLTEDFVPERWVGEGLGPGSTLEPGCILSFSFGPFGCIGRGLAMQELRVVVAYLALHFTLTFPVGFDPHIYRAHIRNIRTTFFPTPLHVVLESR